MNETLLIIDDDQQTLDMFATTLELPGYTITTALGGPDGIESYMRDRPAITFVDLWMPDKDGFQVLREIRAQDPEAEVILMTSHSDKNTMLAALRAYASDFVLKPVSHEVMDNVLRRAHQRLQVKRKLQAAQTALQASHTNLEQQVAARTAELEAANRALRESEARYRELAGSITDMFFAMDQDLRYTFWNRACERLTGIAAQDALGKSLYELFPDETSAKAAAVYREVLATQQPQSFVNESRIGDTDFYFEVNAYPARQGVSVFVKDITERKQAEEERTQAEAALRSQYDLLNGLLESLPVGAVVLDADGRPLHANPMTTTLTGYTAEDIPDLDTLFSKAYPDPAYRAQVKADRQKAAQFTGTPPHDNKRELRVTCRDGAIKDIEFRGAFLANGRTIMTMVDITDRKRAAGELSNAKAMLQATFEQSPVPMVLVSMPEAIFEIVNPATLEFLGMSDEPSVVGTSLRDFTPSFQDLDLDGTPRQSKDLPLARALRGEKTLNEERRIIRKDGASRWELVSGMPIYNRQGEILAGYLIMVDITKRKQAKAALRESEERFRTAFYTSPDAVNINRLSDGLYLEVNDSFLRIMGYTREEIIGQTSLELDIWADPHDRERLVAGLRADGFYENLEAQFRRKDGKLRTGLMSARVLQMGEELCILSITRDITEWKYLEHQLRRQERLAAVGQLAAGIAHDFRNLLTTIMLYAQLSLRKPGLPSQVGQALDIIHGESKKAATLVQQILDFSSRAMVILRPLDLGASVSEIVTTLQRMLPENIRLTATTGNEDYTIAGDLGQIQQVLMNLALNSRDAMPNGGDLRFILSHLTVAPGETPPVVDMPPGVWVSLAVTDTGTGMSETVTAHLFEPFFTTKEVGKGTGLGLAQVYGIVRQHRGYIGVTTADSVGTTFTLYFPASSTAPSESRPFPTAPPGQGETILLVEDNDKLRAAGQSLLETLGYRAITAAHGREALEIYTAAENQIDLVITDIVMPEMDGKELLLELRRLAPQMKAVGVTGYAIQESLETLQEAGFLDVLHKPFDIETLSQAIRRALAVPERGQQ